MEHEGNSEKRKNKPRGRPFAKGANGRKPKDSVLAPTGHETSDGGTNIVLPPNFGKVDVSNTELFLLPVSLTQQVNDELYSTLANINDNLRKENMEIINSMTPEFKIKEEEVLELEDFLEFKRGDDVLSIKFSKKSNRKYVIQIFLNGNMEIRPAIYTGSITGKSFWNMLKSTLRTQNERK